MDLKDTKMPIPLHSIVPLAVIKLNNLQGRKEKKDSSVISFRSSFNPVPKTVSSSSLYNNKFLCMHMAYITYLLEIVEVMITCDHYTSLLH